MTPYLIVDCFERSSADVIGDSIRSTVKKAARFAVYEDIMMSVKNHHVPATILVERALRQTLNEFCEILKGTFRRHVVYKLSLTWEQCLIPAASKFL